VAHELYYYDVLVNVEVLDAELRAAVGDAFDGIIYATAENELRVLLTEETLDWRDAVDAVVAAHNSAAQTPAQALDAEERAIIAELVAQAQQAIATIDADIAAIPAADVAALKAILTRGLRREKHEIRAIVRLAHEVLRIN
jgi:hypothetical protein